MLTLSHSQRNTSDDDKIQSAMNSPELSLDMNLDSPSATDVHAQGEGGSGGGDGIMGCGENNASTGVDIIQHSNHYQHHEGHNTHCNDQTNNCSSFGSCVDNISGTNSSSLDRANQYYGKGGAINKIDCDKTTSMIEDWKEELSMMRVKNAILLDDLVKIGANL